MQVKTRCSTDRLRVRATISIQPVSVDYFNVKFSTVPRNLIFPRTQFESRGCHGKHYHKHGKVIMITKVVDLTNCEIVRCNRIK